MKKTVTELVKSIPERLGLDLDLSTPQKAYDFLNDKDFPIFYLSGNSRNLENYVYSPTYTEWIVKCGHRAMYIFNDLFSPEDPSDTKKYESYGIDLNETKICDLVDYEDNIGFYEDISFYEKENTQYIAILPGGFVSFKSVLNACGMICKETNDYIHFECRSLDDKEFGYDIAPDGSVESFGEFRIKDNNADCFAGDLSLFISLFGCETFEDMEEICVPYAVEILEQKRIDKNCGLFYLYKNRATVSAITDETKAAEIVEKYPVAFESLPENLQQSKTVAMAFIKGNDQYMAAYNKIKSEYTIFSDGVWMQLGEITAGDTANLALNGVVPCDKWHSPISNEVLNSWCENEKIFESLLRSSMRSWCRISDELFQKLDHKKLFSLEPYYIIVLRGYYSEHTKELDEKTREKEDLHIRRKYRLSEDVSEDNIITLKAIEKIEKDCPEAIKILSGYLNDTETVALMKSYLLALPKEERDNLIKRNIRLAYPIRNDLSNDDEIVDYICEMCECAGDFLSDEIVEKRGLKRTNLDMSKVCADCYFC